MDLQQETQGDFKELLESVFRKRNEGIASMKQQLTRIKDKEMKQEQSNLFIVETQKY